MRSPYERVFAHRNKRVSYRGLKKVQLQVGIRALVFNLKRVVVSDKDLPRIKKYCQALHALQAIDH